jgi:ABC-type Fe3+ transport system substrate-binding protein
MSYLFNSLGLALSVATLVCDGFAADAKAYTFIASRDEIVAKAKMEGKLRVVGTMDPSNIKASSAAFKKIYPFIDINVVESQGVVAAQRLLLAIKGGTAKEWDVILVSADFRDEYPPYLWKIDLLGMAKQGVVKIPPPMIDGESKSILGTHTLFQVTAYNKNLVPANLAPKTYEDFLRPEFKGKKFAVDMRPKDIAGLVPVWGLEKTLAFARKIAAQEPIWARGSSNIMPRILAGEIPMMMGPNYGSVRQTQLKDTSGVLQYSIPEPVAVRFGNSLAILATAEQRHAAILWLEWLASPAAQKIADETEPFASSMYVHGGAVEQELRGRKLSIEDTEALRHVQEWREKIVEAFGFPRAK